MTKKSHILLTISVVLLLTLVLVPGSPASAEGETEVSISGPGEISPGEQFTIDIQVTPGEAIAGVQFNLAFDASLLSVDSVAEGDLLTQDGASTYFSAGTINNGTGSISGVAGAIITPGQTVADNGTFAIVTMTAGMTGGTSSLTLSNVVVGDINGQAVTANVVNSSVAVTSSEDNPLDIPGGSGGGGGGGGGQLGITYLTEYITGSGRLTDDVEAPSADGSAELYLADDTYCLNRVGVPLQFVSFQLYNSTVNPPENAVIVGPVYDISPDGSTFSPALNLSLSYDEAGIPEGVAEKNLIAATYDSNSQHWQNLESYVDPDSNIVTAEVSHFSIFSILAYTRPASFELTDFLITSTEVDAGEAISASVVVSNNGDLSDSYEINLIINDITAQTKEVMLEGNESQTVSFDFIPDSPGEFRVSIGNLSSMVTVREPQEPAAFVANEIIITPVEVILGESSTVSVIISNTGQLAGSYQPVLSLGETFMESQEITLNGGESTTVEFEITPNTIGIQELSILGLSETLNVVLPDDEGIINTRLDVSPVYNGETGKLSSTEILYWIDNIAELADDTELAIRILYADEILEEFSYLLNDRINPDNTVNVNYMPSSGWEAGTYTYQADLYRSDGTLYDNTRYDFEVTPDVVTTVVSWNILGWIIGASLLVISVVLALVIYKRRDMLRGGSPQ